MELLDKNTERLKDIWKGEDDRQNAKVTLLAAIMAVPEITMRQAQDIFDKLDEMLDSQVEEPKPKRDTAL